MRRAGGMSGCTERVVGMLQPPAKPGAAQAKLQAKGASNLLHPPTSLLSVRWAARRSCIGCCWLGSVKWRHVSSWGYVWVYRARSGRAAAACKVHKAWCSAAKLQAKGASNLLLLPSSLLSSRRAARRSCIGCCWVGPVMWRHVSRLGCLWVYSARSGRAAAACKAWCSASKAPGQGSFEPVACTNEPSQHRDGQHVTRASDAVG